MSAPTPSPVVALSAITDSDAQFLRELGARKELLGADAAHDAFRGRRRDDLNIAAFLGDFDPTTLIPGITEGDLQHLLRDCTVSGNGVVTRWRLKATARARLLVEFEAPAALLRCAAAAEAYQRRLGAPPDALTTALVSLARREYPDRSQLAALGNEMWAAYRTALGALKDTPVCAAALADRISSEIERAEFLDPFRFLTGWDARTGEDTFVGRQSELARLRGFVDALSSEGISESISRAYTRLRSSSGRALILSGVGGVGKSTLVAKFILQHAEATRSSGAIRFAYLDFDRSTVNAVQPATLLMEIARQLSWQVPEAKQALETLRERIRGTMSGTRHNPDPSSHQAAGSPANPSSSRQAAGGDLPEELLGPSELNRYFGAINDLLEEVDGRQSETVLVVLDTFEEVQALGDEAVRRVEVMVDVALSKGRQWRILLVGRDAATDAFEKIDRIALGEFRDQESRRTFLEARGVPRPLSAKVAKEAGGRPLALLLAARLVKEQGIKAIELSFADRVGGLFRDHLTEGILYQRILDHIDDPDVRLVAHPGLVLRRLDADVIGSVVVPTLGLTDFNFARIEKIMAALRRQKDLVRVESDQSVTHRPDVRAQMLVLMSADMPAMVKRLHSAAIDYYLERQQAPGASAEMRERSRIEELYHRFCLGTDLDQVVTRWIAPARMALARVLDEIPDECGKVALKIMLGRLPTSNEARDLPPLLLRELAVRTIKSAIANAAPETVFDMLPVFQREIPQEVAERYFPLLNDRAGNWAAAREGYLQLLADGRSAGTLGDEWVLEAVDFFEREPMSAQDSHFLTPLLENGLSQLSRRSQADAELARLRLTQRRSAKPPSNQAVPGSPKAAPLSGPISNQIQWQISLSSAAEESRMHLFDGAPVTDIVRRQLQFLAHAIRASTHQPDGDYADALELCEGILEGDRIRASMNPRVASVANRPAAGMVIRHIMRPATPQWYVPLAVSLRAQLGKSIETADLYDVTLPRLPDGIPAKVSRTSSLADLLGQFDQIGVLRLVAEHIRERKPALQKSNFSTMLDAYQGWRRDLFPILDPWFEQLLGQSRQRSSTRLDIR